MLKFVAIVLAIVIVLESLLTWALGVPCSETLTVKEDGDTRFYKRREILSMNITAESPVVDQVLLAWAKLPKKIRALARSVKFVHDEENSWMDSRAYFYSDKNDTFRIAAEIHINLSYQGDINPVYSYYSVVGKMFDDEVSCEFSESEKFDQVYDLYSEVLENKYSRQTVFMDAFAIYAIVSGGYPAELLAPHSSEGLVDAAIEFFAENGQDMIDRMYEYLPANQRERVRRSLK